MDYESSSSLRPSTTSALETHPSSRRSMALSFLDLRPLPEDMMMDGGDYNNLSFESNDKSVSSWKDEGERKNALNRLPSSSSQRLEYDQDIKKLSSTNTAKTPLRPQTAPVGSCLTSSLHREGPFLSSNKSARSAQYLAIQWRSRATQLSLSTTSLVDSSPPPSATKVSDDDGSSSNYESDSDSSKSSNSEYSGETMDESIKSQVSNAQKVVEKWQQRWHERSESISFCSESASRDEEEEKRIYASAETHKMENAGGAREDLFEDDALQFAVKPTTSERALIVDDGDNVQLKSALEPYPLQPVTAGKEYLSDSQKRLGAFIDEDNSEEEEVSMMLDSQNSIFVTNGSGAVVETRGESLANIDDNLSQASSSSNALEYNDDELSEHSTAEQSAHFVEKELNDTNISYETQTAQQSIVNTFCEVPETFVSKPTEPLNQTSTAPQAPENNELNVDQTPKITHSSRKTTRQSQKNIGAVGVEKPPSPIQENPPSPAIATKIESVTNKMNNEFTGSVQERIEAVKRAREEARKNHSIKKADGSKTTPTTMSKKKRPKSGGKVEKSTTTRPLKTAPTKIKWVEHDVDFTFGLLTNKDDSPPTGAYPKEDEGYTSYKNKLKTKSKLLHEVMTTFGEIIRRTKSLGNGSTKYMMCSPDRFPRPIAVKQDVQFKAPRHRPNVSRCVVLATVPIFVPKGNEQAKEVATHVVLDLFAVAISKGEFDDFAFEKIV